MGRIKAYSILLFESEDTVCMMGLPAGLGSECPAGAAEWWPQCSEPPAHESAALGKRSRGFSPHSDSMHEHTSTHSFIRKTTAVAMDSDKQITGGIILGHKWDIFAH